MNSKKYIYEFLKLKRIEKALERTTMNLTIQSAMHECRANKILQLAHKPHKIKVYTEAFNYASVLHQNPDNFTIFMSKTNAKQRKLLNILVANYNKHNCNLYNKNPEDSTPILRMVMNLKNPKNVYFNIIEQLDIPFADLEKVFKCIKGSKKRLQFIQQSFTDLAPKQESRNNSPLPIKLLESKYAKKYINNYERYRSFLLLNKDDENAVSKLDALIETKSFNKKMYDKQYQIYNIFQKKAIIKSENFNEKLIEKNYSKESTDLLSAISKKFGTYENSIKEGTDKLLADIYMSTTKKNSKLRIGIFNNFKNNIINYDIKNSKEYSLEELNKLYSKVDNNKYTKNIIRKLVKNNIKNLTFKELNTILENNNPRLLNIYFKNFENICKQTRGKERLTAIKEELRNPFFETKENSIIRSNNIKYGFSKKESFFSKFKKRVNNQINIIKEKISNHFDETQSENVIPKTSTETITPVINKNTETDKITPTNDINKKSITKTRLKIARTTTKIPSARKLKVINDVDNLISKKLGPKTFDSQKRDYAIKATKMRLNLLPEIFDSIKETRALNRSKNITNNIPSNKDALTLYEMINGKNKKLINFMLKKRNSDGTRVFSVKDITSIIETTDRKILKNTQLMDRKAKSLYTKDYYQNLYELNIAKYGKLERQKH